MQGNKEGSARRRTPQNSARPSGSSRQLAAHSHTAQTTGLQGCLATNRRVWLRGLQVLAASRCEGRGPRRQQMHAAVTAHRHHSSSPPAASYPAFSSSDSRSPTDSSVKAGSSAASCSSHSPAANAVFWKVALKPCRTMAGRGGQGGGMVAAGLPRQGEVKRH